MAELTPKTIGELPTAVAPSNADLFPISHSGESQKISWGTLKSALPQLGNLSATQGTISGGEAWNFTVANYMKGMILLSSASTTKMDIIIYYGRNGSDVAFTRLTDATDLTVTSSTNTLTITPAGSAAAYYLQISYQ